MSKEYTYIPKKRVCHKLMIHPLLGMLGMSIV